MARPETTERRRRLLRDARCVLRRRYAEIDLSLADVADELVVSPRQLQRVFREEAGEDFRAALLRLRMERAAKLLRQGMTARRVATRVGYRRPSGLRQALLRYYEKNASEFQPRRTEYLGNVTFSADDY